MAYRHWSKVAPPVPVERRTDHLGRVFDSKGEMVFFAELELKQRYGYIRNLRRQVSFDLILTPQNGIKRPILIRSAGFPKGRIARYTADAVYEERVTEGLERGQWRTVYAEFKGMIEPVAQLRIAVFEAIYGVTGTLAGTAARKIDRKRKQIDARRRA